MELITERCEIRKLNHGDAADLFQVLSDERVMAYIEPVFDMEQTERFIQTAGLSQPPQVYGIVWKETGKVIGHAIFHLFEEEDYEIGWVLHRDFWSRGIADEVTKALIKYAKYLKIGSCVIECAEGQSASKQIAMNNGFLYEGRFDGLERYRLTL